MPQPWAQSYKEILTQFKATLILSILIGCATVLNQSQHSTLVLLKFKHKIFFVGSAPGLVVRGGESCSRGCEFDSGWLILDGVFFTHWFVVKMDWCLQRLKRNEKEAGDGRSKKKCRHQDSNSWSLSFAGLKLSQNVALSRLRNENEDKRLAIR